MPWEIVFSLNFWIWVPVLMILMGLLWLLQLFANNTSLADLGFCGVFFLLVLACSHSSDGDLLRRMMLLGMGGIYAFRLGSHVFRHRILKHSEDARYQTIRRRLQHWEKPAVFFYFQLQVPGSIFFAGLLCWLMSPSHIGIRWWDGLGVAIFMVAVSGEALADRQLEAFRSQAANTGKTLRTGLWRYSRHPNYFFESLHWWAYVPMAIGLPWSWMAPLWPLLMMSALLWVTGIPWAEAQAEASRGEDYRNYQRTTSAFIPWIPKEPDQEEGQRIPTLL